MATSCINSKSQLEIGIEALKLLEELKQSLRTSEAQAEDFIPFIEERILQLFYPSKEDEQ